MRGCSQPSHKRHSFTAACCPQEWRLDITLFVLLLAAFAAANALSLVTITFVGLGMALRPQAQQVGLRTPPVAQPSFARVHLLASPPPPPWPSPLRCAAPACFCCSCCLTPLRLLRVAAAVQACGGAHARWGSWSPVRCAAGPAAPPAPPAGHGWRTEGAPAEKGAMRCLSFLCWLFEQCRGCCACPSL